ncbi:MAG TPA: 30S ribosomal protein S4 [Anaerolineae bacterium]|nr:30S ribosomal protein S4 [Anaerolineae bacterium]HQH37553.1 30S ribosomal protein S4 [Anaerolineae bacterium]
MARYIGPSCKLCRREGMKLYLKGDKCYAQKCPFEQRAYPPGQHGKETAFRRRKLSDYAMQLREKQKARQIYGILERQFRRYYREAQRRPGLTGENLLAMLESRLDNVVYRLGLADSRAHARQLVEHGHFMVNGRVTDIPAFLVHPTDLVSVRPESRRAKYFKERKELLGKREVPAWLSLDAETLDGRVLALPTRQEIDVPVEEHLIVEFYSR